MKKVLLLSIAMMLCASMAMASPGGLIGIYADVGATNCYYTPVFGVANVYVVHTLIANASASQFKVDYTAITDPYISETLGAGLLGLGTSANGIGISYAGCLATPLLLLTLTFFDQTLTAPCTTMMVVPDPAAPTGTIEVVDCNATKLVGDGGTLYWGGGAGCGNCPITTAAETTSWGGIKALYK